LNSSVLRPEEAISYEDVEDILRGAPDYGNSAKILIEVAERGRPD